MQQEEGEEDGRELEILKCSQTLVRMKRHTLTLHHLSHFIMCVFHLLPPFMQPPLPFEQLLLWQPRETAEQLCLIDSALFSRVASE